jgi:phosphoribosylanthranilate isomerase
MIRVKVCCILNRAEADLAVSLGASALGLVSSMPSGPGVIDDEQVADIAAHAPPAVATFLLTARQDADGILEQHARCRTSTIQLVDHVEVRELERLRRTLLGTKLVQVIHVRDAASVRGARDVAPYVDALLLDSGNPNLAVKELGGTGRVHDWGLSAEIRSAVDKPVFLAGGLRASNVAEALRVVAPFGLDLCTGVRTDGALSAEKLRAFMDAVHAA